MQYPVVMHTSLRRDASAASPEPEPTIVGVPRSPTFPARTQPHAAARKPCRFGMKKALARGCPERALVSHFTFLLRAIPMQASSRSWFLLRVAVLAAAAFAVLVGICVVAAAESRAPVATALVDFTGMWTDNENTGYNEEDDNHDSVVRDSVVGHAQRQLDILRGHLSRQALCYVQRPYNFLPCEYLSLFAVCTALSLSLALNTSTSAFS
jgi:hypothetical protein